MQKLMVPLVTEFGEERVALGKKFPKQHRDRLMSFAREWDETGRWRSQVDAQFGKRYFIRRPKLLPSSRRTYASQIKGFLNWGITAGHFKDKACASFDPGK